MNLQKQAWPADSVERRAVADLVPAQRNPRTHSPAQIAEIAASMREWGWTTPVLVDEENQIIAGHGRLAAAMKLDIESIPVMVARGWSEAQKKAYGIADNQLALNAGWDMDLLRLEFKDLKEWGFDCELTGFEDLDSLMADRTTGQTDPDDVPDAPAEPITQAGDRWILGRHVLVCGDSTKKSDVGKLLQGVKPHLMVTDPPYGVGYDAEWRSDAGLQKTGAHGKVDNDDRSDWRAAWALFPGEVAYVWHGVLHTTVVANSLTATDFDLRSFIVWAKNRMVISRGHYHWQHESCWYAVRNGGTGHWQGDRKQTTLWFIDTPPKSELGHSTQKPVECMRRPIINNSKAGEKVYEPFAGTGTTMIACEMEGRVCYAMEVNPEYCDITVKRWEDFTGEEAILDDQEESDQDKAAGP